MSGKQTSTYKRAGSARLDVTELAEGVKHLVDSIVDGRLDARADVEKVDPAFRPVLEGVNRLIDAFMAPFNVTAEYVERISRGDIPEKITDQYKGDFNEVRNNLNGLIDALQGLIDEAARMEKAAARGELDVRADVSKYNGAWATIVQGLNDTAEGIAVPMKDIGDVLDRMAAGDLKARVTNDYKGDYEVLKKACNGLGDQLQGVQEVLEEVKTAFVKGELDVRGDASRFKGEIAGMVTGLNDVLEAVIGPLNVTAEYVERISRGDIPEKITDEYKGDFNEIKNNLNGLIDSLNLIAEIGEKMADGDLRVEIKPRSEQDLLLKSLAKMVANLNDSLGQVNIAVEQIAAGSQQVSDSSQALSQGATEQASSLEEITSSMSQIASQIKQNAENASQANKLAAEARNGAERGNAQMKEMVEAMNEINDSSQNISKIIKVIDEIAFQTNLLALNAAVEAARAGKHGKGFAVVAEEVRNLAARSAKAAKETAELIEGSVQKVGMGTEAAQKTAEALDEIVTGVTKVTDLVGEIAAASNEQAQGVSQINQGLGQIDQVTQQNTATAEESASASEELSGQAAQLREMVGRFKLANRKARSGVPAMDQITPEMIEMLHKLMQQQGMKSSGLSIHGASAETEEKEKGGNGKTHWGGVDPAKIPGVAGESIEQVQPDPVIVLDDKEFGRY